MYAPACHTGCTLQVAILSSHALCPAFWFQLLHLTWPSIMPMTERSVDVPFPHASPAPLMLVDQERPGLSRMQLTLRAGSGSNVASSETLDERQRSLDLREQMLDSREADLTRRENELRRREENLANHLGSLPTLRKLPCEKCGRAGRNCGRREPCFDAQGYLLHHHHTCTECHDAQKAQRRAARANHHA